MVRFFLLPLGILAGLIGPALIGGASAAPFQPVVLMCGDPPAPCTEANPLPTTATIASGTFDESVVAIAALPTLAPGTVTPRGSLAGAQYMQPVFGSASGGGTQVDGSNGLPVNIVAGATVAQGSTTSGQEGSLILGAVTTAAPSYTTAQTSPLSLTTAGALRVSGAVTGTVTANAGTDLNTSLLALESGGNLATLAGAVSSGKVQIGVASPYPTGATPLTASATGTTAATAATLAKTSGKTTYVCGFSITSDATVGLAGAATVAGTITGTLNYIQGVGVAPAVSAVNQTFAPCIPASATNTDIVVTSAAAGTGGNTAVTAWGFQL